MQQPSAPLPKQTEEITVEIQTPDSDDESKQAKRQRPDEVKPEMSDDKSVS